MPKNSAAAPQTRFADHEGYDGVMLGVPGGPTISSSHITATPVYLAGSTSGAPFLLIKNTRNFAGFVLLAFRLTT
jgi:hypothetical protein